MLLLNSGVRLRDYTFDNLTMLQDKKRLGDQSAYFEPFVTDDLHGVFTVAASCECRDMFHGAILDLLSVVIVS